MMIQSVENTLVFIFELEYFQLNVCKTVTGYYCNHPIIPCFLNGLAGNSIVKYV